MNTAQSLTILFATQTGNTMAVAESIEQQAIANGFDTTLIDMLDCTVDDLQAAEILLLAVSTQGAGQPPFDAQELYKLLHSNKAPSLDHLRYSVLALGDSNYEFFCKTGKDFDLRLEQLGAQRFHPRADCDADYKMTAKTWTESVLNILSDNPAQISSDITVTTDDSTQSQYLAQQLMTLPLTSRTLLSGSGSNKEVIHLEFSLADTDITYETGDNLAIYPKNCPVLVNKLLSALGLSGEQTLPSMGNTTLREALLIDFDISNITSLEIDNYAHHTDAQPLREWFAQLQEGAHPEYQQRCDWLDIIEQFPPKSLSAEDFAACLRRLAPRLYSISSSSIVHERSIHLTVTVVRYTSRERKRNGVCSTYLADRIALGDTIVAHVQPNKHFRLPQDPATPIIMVGPGCGVAPFRAFMQERSSSKQPGKSWILFGDQCRNTDFLYESEWQEHQTSGTLSHIDLAFSRDTEQKIYVQHRLRENSKRLYEWLEDGAYLYVCGDGAHMAQDVDQAIEEVITTEGVCSVDDARNYIAHLRKDRRYLLDVY